MPKQINGIKFCTKCKIQKSVSEFHKDRKNSDGLSSECKECKRKYRISPFYVEREKQLERTPEYRARRDRYRKTEKGKLIKSREHHSYQTRNSGKTHTLTYLEWEYILSRQGKRCAICRCVFDDKIKAVRDCMVPLSKGGLLTLGNTQAVCTHCNAVKHDKAYSGLGNSWRLDYIS